MAADSLREILAIARREAAGVPDEIWKKIEEKIRQQLGAQTHYIAAQRKRQHLAALDAASKADQAADAAQLSKMLNISVRRVQQLKKLG